MGKKYLDIKKGSLEDSILGVWQTAAEQTETKIDGRTTGYRTHRERLETRRTKREEKKTTAKEAAETESYEMGTDEYREYLERLTPGEVVNEGSKEEYEKFFNAAMKKFKINSPSDLKSDEEKKKFFDYIDKNYTKEEEKIQLARDFKVSSMKEALAKVWGLDEKSAKYLELEFKDSTTAVNAYRYINHKIEPGGSQPWDDFNQEGNSIQFENMKDADSLMKDLERKFKFKVYEREEKEENRGKTLTGKRSAAVEIDPKADLDKN